VARAAEAGAVLRAVVVDDEAYARKKVREFLRAEKDIEVVGEAGNGTDAVRVIRETDPDLVFLDVQMPKPDGFGVVEALGRDRLPHVIFATAFDQYTLRAFEVHALDYLLKPFDRERFREALRHARRVIRADRTRDDLAGRIRSLIEEVRADSPYLRRFLVQSKNGARFLKAEDVLFLEASGSYVTLRTEAGDHLLRETLNDLEGRLDPRLFVRTHRSYIANLEAIQEIQRHFHGESVLILKGGGRVPVSRGYRDRFRQALGGRS
jgi:two-component system, LytTR family, response regulator